MLTRSSRSSLARVFLSARSNSSVSADSAAAATTASPEATVPKPKRSIPLASLFGDIEIPASAAAPAAKANAPRTPHDFTPDLSWLADDEFDGRAPLSSRLARSRPNNRPDAQATEPKFQAGRLHVPPTLPKARSDAPKQQGRPWQGQAPFTREKQMRNVRSRPAEGTDGQRRDERRDRGQQVDKRQVGPRKQPRERQEDTPPQRARVRDVEARAGEKRRSPQVVDVRRATEPLPMKIQTTDLEKLFGPAESARPAVPMTASDASAGATNAVAGRIQAGLENVGGDYSRYLPADLAAAIKLPETLGPISTARLGMARKRDASLNMRSNALGIIQNLVVQKVASTQIEVRP
ncbi:uncharacterized protein LAESUDRAFT_757434 [Laetiporus sulphureus 93-53]|uniref:Uncharacterized protein n=1 Tax=Laetiporus sulphureus 93-53 TaxID=1314785 RepID=A0A165FBK2_9APHY|nr:uncharacterized protein LAESUDRAFT_757434 [Laetiporus sulphureus 93-53]KZT08719.1 hypothetical protein LAESUDRAFT_757434 [Laetiporus sulphureus 93-53]